MMNNQQCTHEKSIILSILAWGAVWGIFEATVGYLLHMLPVKIGWMVWYPVACFFMAGVYRKTRSLSAILGVGVLCASIKLLNLLLPIRVDKVINPAISIVFEAIAMAGVVYLIKHFLAGKLQSALSTGLCALGMNTGWRLIYAVYLLVLVPDWMREISVISSSENLFTFFATHNLTTSLLLFAGYQARSFIVKPIDALCEHIARFFATLPPKSTQALKISIVGVLLCTSAILELLL